MAVSEKIVCDVCEIERGPSNHWIMATATSGEVKFQPWDVAGYHGRGHICGTECASKLVARSIDEWRKS